MFAFSGNASENGAHEGGELFLTEDGTNDANGDASEKGTDGDLVDGAGDADTSLKIVGGSVVVSGAVVFCRYFIFLALFHRDFQKIRRHP